MTVSNFRSRNRFLQEDEIGREHDESIIAAKFKCSFPCGFLILSLAIFSRNSNQVIKEDKETVAPAEFAEEEKCHSCAEDFMHDADGVKEISASKNSGATCIRPLVANHSPELRQMMSITALLHRF